MNTLRKYLTFGLLFIGICYSPLSLAQQSNSMYFMDRIPQSNQLNPATQPQCGFYIGFPGFSSFEINAGNSAISFNDVLQKMPGLGDSLVWPLYNQDTKTKFLSNFSDVNYINSDFRNDWISFGFRIKNTYLSFSAGDRSESYGFIPKDLVKLGLDLNYSNQTPGSFDLSNFGVKAQWYREYAIGVSQQINPNFTFGLRAKLLFGIASLATTNSEVRLNNTGPMSWQTQSIIDMNSSVPNLELKYKSNGDVDFDSIDFKSIDGYSDAKGIIFNTSNTGFAVDLGVISQPLKNLSISASVLDLGFIRWKSNVNNFSQSGSYNFRGVDIPLDDSIDTGDALKDTLEKVYAVNTNHDPFTTSLTGKLYVGVHYQLIKGIGFGALTRLQMLRNNIKPQFTFSLNLDPGKTFSATISYTIANGVYDNLGLGIATRLGPFQYYIICDRIPLFYNWEKSGYPIPAYAKNINFRTGINFVFGCTRNKKALKNKPLLPSE
ncbi:MAG TPA: DUF5723 family protein [Bacteroidales bacterium]|nr:DUF5723 family protein [Bacteroidales bacterium]